MSSFGLATAPPKLVAGPRPATLPLSYAQARLWLLQKAWGISHQLPEALWLRGALDRAALAETLNVLVARHEALRTFFEDRDGEPVQVIAASVRISLPVEDLRGLPRREQDARVQAALAEEWTTPFDLSRGPMVRARLLQVADDEHVLIRTLHHIVSDAWSQAVFNRECFAVYDARRAGRPNPLDPLPVQYADFAVWQRAWLDGGALTAGLAYWRTQLAGLPERLALPTDRPRPPVQTFDADVHRLTVVRDVVQALKRVGQEHQATLFMTALSAFAALLARYTGQSDIAIGSPIANRPDPQLDGLIGFFVNSLVLRVHVRPRLTFAELLRAVRQTTLDAYRHQDVPFERLVDELAPARSPNTTPLVQTVFALQNAPWAPPVLPGLAVQPVASQTRQIRFDLEVHAVEREGALTITWLSNRDLFDGWRIAQMARHFETLLRALATDASQAVEAVPLVDEHERQRLFDEPAAAPLVSEPPLLLTRFETQAAATPHARAIVAGSRTETYATVNARANRLARRLIAAGIGPEDLVAVAVPRSAEMIVALLAIVKAGAAYLPLDPDSPAARVQRIVEDARPVCAVAVSATAAAVPPALATMLVDGSDPADDAAGNVTDGERRLPLHAAHPAYVIYTSGSTGTPKGVVIAHRALASYVDWACRRYHLQPGLVPITTSLAFDATVTSLWLPLVTGGTVLATSERGHVEMLASLFAEQTPLELVKVTPSYLTSLQHLLGDRAGQARVARAIVGGEAFGGASAAFWRASLPHAQIVNEYGPTEATVGCCVFELGAAASASVPIGRPTPGTRAYVLDAALQLVPAGVAGELYLAGAQLARGYLHGAAETASRFVADPYSAAGERMYRTGDRVRSAPDGALEFVGRVDRQIKLRGYRIERGEVEAVARAHAGVLDANAMVVGDGEAARLVLYAVARDTTAGDRLAEELRERFAAALPAYLAPVEVRLIEAFPLTPNGKIDEPALAALAVDPPAAAVSPRTPEEEVLCAMFSEALGGATVGVDDDFFEIGGNSIVAMRVISRIRAAWSVDVSVATILEAPTVAELARRLHSGGPARAPLANLPDADVVPCSYGQIGLWMVGKVRSASSTAYNMPEAWRLRGTLDCAVLGETLNVLIARHESLRTHFAEVDGEPVQVIAPELRIALPVEDLRGRPRAEQEARVQAALVEEWRTPFDLATGPVIRARLLRLAEDEHVFLRTLHHIVSDAWSQGVFNRECLAIYDALRAGQPPLLPPLPIQYADFALWQRTWLDGGVLAAGLEYWRKQLAGIPDRLELPADRPRHAATSFDAGVHRITVAREHVAALKQVSQTQHATLFMTALSALAVLLARYTGQFDIVIGSPIANRQDVQLEGLIGYFVNSLPLRIQVQPTMTFTDLLRAVRQTTLAAYQHQDVPFERLVEELASGQGLSATPLFQVVFALQNAPWVPPQLPGLTVEPVLSATRQVRADLEIHAWEQGGELTVLWLYRHARFDRWRIEQMAHHYGRLLAEVTSNA